jgi:hypothetical protein
VTALKRHTPAVKMLLHPVAEMFAKFANFDRFKSFIGYQEEHGEALHPSRFVGPTPLLVLGKDEAVRGTRAPGRMPGGEELGRDLRSHEPEPLAGMRDLTRL